MKPETVRLTEYTHGGGCGCKLAPSVLQDILKGYVNVQCTDLIVGQESLDDAAVFRLSDDRYIVATTDFFTPIVDDPFHYGAIAAANAISDVYAMGAKPFLALAILGFPIKKLSADIAREILRGAQHTASQAQTVIAGGHSIDNPEPIFGLAVIGEVHPNALRTNAAAKIGDDLILTKPIGIGVMSAACKRGLLPKHDYDTMIKISMQLNTLGIKAATLPAVHAMTDVTGFGLAGQLLELCRASGLSATIHASDIPIISEAMPFFRNGVASGASARNWSSYSSHVRTNDDNVDLTKAIITDPQTNGGLLLSVASDHTKSLLTLAHDMGFPHAAKIGQTFANQSQESIVYFDD